MTALIIFIIWFVWMDLARLMPVDRVVLIISDIVALVVIIILVTIGFTPIRIGAAWPLVTNGWPA